MLPAVREYPRVLYLGVVASFSSVLLLLPLLLSLCFPVKHAPVRPFQNRLTRNSLQYYSETNKTPELDLHFSQYSLSDKTPIAQLIVEAGDTRSGFSIVRK